MHTKLSLFGILTVCAAVFSVAHVARAATPVFTSPSGMCEYYNNRWEQGLFHVVPGNAGECLVQVGDSNSGIGYIRGYYSGTKFCMDSYGAYYNNAGISNSTQCIPTAARGGSGTTRSTSMWPSWDDWKNLPQEMLNDPNFKWAAAAAVIIAAVTLSVSALRRRRAKRP